jgi:hypothetical protein
LHPDLRNQQVPHDDQGTLRDKHSLTGPPSGPATAIGRSALPDQLP